jgi:hypothetical protein
MKIFIAIDLQTSDAEDKTKSVAVYSIFCGSLRMEAFKNSFSCTQLFKKHARKCG